MTSSTRHRMGETDVCKKMPKIPDKYLRLGLLTDMASWRVNYIAYTKGRGEKNLNIFVYYDVN